MIWLRGIATIMCILVLGGCSSAPQRLDPKVVHKKDLTFCVKDVACYKGAGVAPQLDRFELEVAPRKEENVDRVVFGTCHRNEAYYTEELPNVNLPFLSGLFGKQKRGKNWPYVPTPGMEDTGDCDLYIYALDFESEDHSWGVLRTKNPKYQLNARLFCNGDGGRNYDGVSVCDAKAGTYQQVVFGVPVEIRVKPPNCPIPVRQSTGVYKWPVSVGKCAYLITSEDKRAHSMLIFGWQTFKFQKG